MEFQDKIKQLAARAETISKHVQTEEGTKTSLILPFFSLLGYDVFSPLEFVPEFTADVGIKKGEKVDYAIIIDEKPVILIETKCVSETLDKHGSQLFRYFTTTEAKFGILTNGIIYQFFTDLDAQNKMDDTPFLEIDILNMKDSSINELKKFEKSNFNVDNIFDSASELRYSNQIKKILADEIMNPSDNFVRFFLNSIYDGLKRTEVIDKFRPIVKRSISQYVNETVNNKLKSATQTLAAEEAAEEAAAAKEAVPENEIITTEEELEAYNVIRGMLMGCVDANRIYYRDTKTYFNILLDNKNYKWLCRLRLDLHTPSISFPDENKKEVWHNLGSINSLYKFKDDFIKVIQRYDDM